MAHTVQCIMDQNSIDQKKASVSISTQNLPALGILNVLKTPHALAWSSLEIVQFITQWVLSLHGLSFSLWSLKRAEAGRPIGTRELLARPMRALHFLNSPPIVWPSVGGPSRREQGGTLPLVCVKGSFRDRMKIIRKRAQALAFIMGKIFKCWVFVIHSYKDKLPQLLVEIQNVFYCPP